MHPDWVDSIKDDWPKVWQAVESARIISGDDMAAFLCWLGVRVIECHRVLKPTGSFYLHCDHTAHAYLKTLMDAIFGKKNFRNEIVWDYTFRLMDLPRFFNRKHDTILFYVKTNNAKFTMPKTEWTREEIIRTRKQKIHVDENGEEWIWMPGGRGNSKNKRKKIADIIEEGKAIADVWPIPTISSSSKERVGYPTQKPLALYERFIKASSKEGDIVLDPFAGCATTSVAAERLGRRWIGIDIWDGAHKTVIGRLQGETQAGMAWGESVYYSTAPPVRTDDGEVAAPTLKLKRARVEPPGPKMSRAEMMDALIEDFGLVCQGCDREFDDKRYLQLDHNTPRSDGGLNHISNRVLLCGPCNRAKSNVYTLSGLRRLNRKNGWMAG